MREYNDEDQWSELERTLCSKEYQQSLAAYYVLWKTEDPKIKSDDDLLDAVIDEILKRNKADLFCHKRLYLDPEAQGILGELREDTRHQMGRLLAKAAKRPERRLQRSLVNFYMWCDLAMKCREARRVASSNSTTK